MPAPFSLTVPVLLLLASAPAYQERGVISFYADSFHGRRTASGAAYDQKALTAAHPKLPFGTLVRVTNPHNGATVVVKITDRGPYRRGRILDLSKEAARRLGMLGRGLVRGFFAVVTPSR